MFHLSGLFFALQQHFGLKLSLPNCKRKNSENGYDFHKDFTNVLLTGGKLIFFSGIFLLDGYNPLLHPPKILLGEFYQHMFVFLCF